jgi:DNA-binding transcriptional ArsR family regulator
MPARSQTSTIREMSRHAADASRLLRALANEHRLLILCLLSEGEFNVSAINDRVELSQSALSQHLAILRADGLVDTRREAQTIYYRLASGPVRTLIETLHGIYCGSPRTARAAARATAKAAPRRR